MSGCAYNENKDEKIMKRVQEHYDYLIEQGYEVVFIALQGSQNYGLDVYDDDYMSDVDTKAVVLPSFKDFVNNKAPVSKTIVLDNEEHIDVKDVRVMFEMFRKMNVSYIELLYTKYKIINPKYANPILKLFKNRTEVSSINRNQFLRCIAGMSMEKVKALKHPYPGLIEKIEKYGFDGKQLSHCVRLQEFITRYVNGEKIEDCYMSKMPAVLINLKKNLNQDGKGYMSVDEAERMCKGIDTITKKIKDENVTEIDIINQKGIDVLNNVKFNLMEQKFKEDLGISVEVLQKKKDECHEKLSYWEKQYRTAKKNNNSFYMHSYKREIDRWQSRLETLREFE